MKIISQKYEVEFINFIKIKLAEKLIKLSSSLFYNITHYYDNKYIKIIIDLEYQTRQIIIEIFKKAIEFIDDRFRNSDERKKQFHINIRNDTRNIKIASIGDIIIDRTYYETKDRSEHFYFIDTLLGLNKYNRYDSIYKATIINLALKTNQKLGGELVGEMYATIQSIISQTDNGIPRQTVYNWINNWNVPKIVYS